jgi:hypothetical protein
VKSKNVHKESEKKVWLTEIGSLELGQQPRVTFSFQGAVLEFIQKLPQSESIILIDVKKTQERCLFGAEVNVKVLKELPNEKTIASKVEISEIPGRSVYISKEFNRFFGNYGHLELELRGMVRKRIICTNIPPYVKNICKV